MVCSLVVFAHLARSGVRLPRGNLSWMRGHGFFPLLAAFVLFRPSVLQQGCWSCIGHPGRACQRKAHSRPFTHIIRVFFRRVFSLPLVAEMGRNAFMGIRVGQKWHIQKFGDRSIGRRLGSLSLPACLLLSPGLVSGRAGPMGGPAARRGGLP